MADVGQINLDLFAAFVFERFLAEQVDVGDGAVVQARRYDARADRRAELNLELFEDLEVIGVLDVGLGHKNHPLLVVLDGKAVSFLGPDAHA